MKIQARNKVVIRRAPKDGRDGQDGQNGLPGMTLLLNPERIVLDTDSDGIVRNFATATCTVQLLRGTASLSPAVFILQQVRCSARVSGSTVRITSVSVDPATKQSYGNAYVDVSASAQGQTLKARISVGVNVQKAIARLENTNREIAQSVEGIKRTESEQAQTLARLSVQQDRISARVYENKTRRHNLLRDTKTLRGDCTVGATTIQDRKVRDFTVARGTAPTDAVYLDIVQWQGLELKTDTPYALSFWARGRGEARAFLYPKACAHSSNSQGFESDSNDGYSEFQLSADWQWCWVVFTTAHELDGKKNLLPFRLMPGASGEVYGVCLVEGTTPAHWLPYNWAPQKNYLAPALAADARVGDVKGHEVVEDAQMGTVRQLTADVGNNFQLVFDAPDYTRLNNKAVTMFIVMKAMSEDAAWCFGGWNNDDELKGSFAFLNRDCDYDDLGDGWRKYHTTFYNVDNRLWDGHSSFGINSLKGTVRVYSAGVVLGEECPEWHTVPLRRGMKSAGLDIDKERIELNGRTVFRNDNAAVPLFDKSGRLNPQLSTAQYLMNVLRSMETVINGGLVIAGLMAAKDGEQVTAYLNGLRQKMHALAAGVRNFGTNEETALSYINFDGSAKFGNLGIGYDGSVNIIDHEGKPRINITPEELPADGELFKKADLDKDFTLKESGQDFVYGRTHFDSTDRFPIADDNSLVSVAATVTLKGYVPSSITDGFDTKTVTNLSCTPTFFERSEGQGEVWVAHFGGTRIRFDNSGPRDHHNLVSKGANGYEITETFEVKAQTVLSAGEWTFGAEVFLGEHISRGAAYISAAKINVRHGYGQQSLHLAHNGFSSIQSARQACYVRNGKLCAFGSMNIPGILLAGTINRNGGISNAWGEYAEGASLQYVQANGRNVARVVFKNALPCGASYVAIANVNGYPTGCAAVVWEKTAKYCDFIVEDINGREPYYADLDVVIIGRNHA